MYEKSRRLPALTVRVKRAAVASATLGLVGSSAFLAGPQGLARAATTIDNPDVARVASCVIDEATKMRAPEDPLAAVYSKFQRSTLGTACGGDPSRYNRSHDVTIYTEDGIGGSPGLLNQISCTVFPALEQVGDVAKWNSSRMCVARFEWVDESLDLYNEFAVFRGSRNGDAQWHVWLRTDYGSKHPGVRRIPGTAMGSADGPPGNGDGPADPGLSDGPPPA